MNAPPSRAEVIAILILAGLGLTLFCWSWFACGSLITAGILTLSGGLLALPFVGPSVAIAAFLLDLLLSLAAWMATRHRSARARA